MDSTGNKEFNKALHNHADWNKQAKEYSQLTKIAINPMTGPLTGLYAALNRILPFSEATAVLDTGTGTGVAISRFIEEFGSTLPPDTKLTASDFSEGMLNVLRESQAEKIKDASSPTQPLWAKLQTEVWDTQDLSAIPDGSLSHVMASFVIFMVPHPDKAISTIHRSLKSGGAFSQASWVSVPWMTMVQDIRAKLRPDEEPVQFKISDTFTNKENLANLLKDGGFKDVTVEPVVGTMGIDGIDTWVNMATRSNNPGFAMFLKGLSEEELDKMADMMKKDLNEKFPDGKIRMHGEAFIATGRKE